MGEIQAKAVLDITADSCPITFVKTKLMLEEMDPGDILEVILNGGEPMHNVPRSVKDEGHRVLKVEPLADNKFRLFIERGQN